MLNVTYSPSHCQDSAPVITQSCTLLLTCVKMFHYHLVPKVIHSLYTDMRVYTHILHNIEMLAVQKKTIWYSSECCMPYVCQP